MKKTIYTLLCILFIAVLLISCKTPEKDSETGWTDLFDGETLDGWVLKEGEGEREFFVEDGMIVSITDMSSPNCYLSTEKSFGDFILELEFLVEPPLNSGVQIRSIVRDKDTTMVYMNGRMEEQEVTFPKGTVVGYQIEVDPSDRAWSGGLYEPGGRGWLQNLEGKPEAQNAYKKDDWNHFRIKAEGNHIQSWVNGVLATDTEDDVFADGFIGIQKHMIYEEAHSGKKMFWKNIKIKEL